MPVKASLELDKTRLLYQESLGCTIRLENATRQALKALNPENASGLPTFILSDLKNRHVWRFARRRYPGAVEIPEDVPPGQVLERSLALADHFQFPSPGSYQLQTHYVWADGTGEVSSTPVAIEVAPSNPRSAFLASATGGPGGMVFNAWLNAVDPAAGRYEVWLSTLSTSRKPKVADGIRLAEVKRPVNPVMTVPPNVMGPVQWVAWVDDGKIFYSLHRFGQVIEPDSTNLPGAAYRIVPPLLLHSERAHERLPGADVLLYEPTPDAPGGRLAVVLIRLGAKGPCEVLATVPTPDLVPLWAKTAYLSNQSRHSFFVVRGAEAGCELKVSQWSPLKPPTLPVTLAGWDAAYLAADIRVTRGDQVRGVVLGDSTVAGPYRFALHQWLYGGEKSFVAADPIPIRWPGGDIAEAVVRIDENGSSAGLLLPKGKDQPWFYLRADGSVGPAPPGVRMPADILFRYGSDPTVVYSDPGRGFQFAKPV